MLDGVDAGQNKCCTPTEYVATTGGNDGSSYNQLEVRFNDTSSKDGLRVSSIQASYVDVYGGGDTVTISDFNDTGTIDMQGCSGNSCGSFWIDGGGHWGCYRSAINLSNHYVFCDNTDIVLNDAYYCNFSGCHHT